MKSVCLAFKNWVTALALSLLFSFLVNLTTLNKLVVRGAVPVSRPVHLTITVTQETTDGALLTWSSSAVSKDVLNGCTLHYGALSDSTKTQKEFHPQETRISLENLASNVSYYALITCQHGRQTYASNNVQFTPRGNENNIRSRLATQNILLPPTFTSRNLPGGDSSIPSERLGGNIEENEEENRRKEEEEEEEEGKRLLIKEEKVSLVSAEGKKADFRLSIGGENSGVRNAPERERQVVIIKESVVNERNYEDVGVPKLQPSRLFGTGDQPPSPHKSPDEGILVIMSQRHMDGPRTDPHNSKPSTSIILGVVCGVVGFIIINVTVVMAVRQYSLRRDQQRRMLELQLEQHGGYIYNMDDLMNT